MFFYFYGEPKYIFLMVLTVLVIGLLKIKTFMTHTIKSAILLKEDILFKRKKEEL